MVQTIGSDTAALLIGEIDEFKGGMKAIVPRAKAFRRLDAER